MSAELRNRVCDDLAAESLELERMVVALDDAGWHTPTSSEGWDVRDTITHLAATDASALLALRDPEAFQAHLVEVLPRGLTLVDEQVIEGRAVSVARTFSDWRSGRASLDAALRAVDPQQRIGWYGPPMRAAAFATARFMETWAHGLDIAEALGVQRAVTDRIRHVAQLGVITRGFSFAVHGAAGGEVPVRVELTAPSGRTWEWGPADAPDRLTGPAIDFCLLVTKRRHRSDLALTATGPTADAWLDVAQAFAGPPSPGRAPAC